jgi:hypothetical protein
MKKPLDIMFALWYKAFVSGKMLLMGPRLAL